MMAQQGQSQGQVNTCSIGFDDPDFDESAYAQSVATRYATRHHAQVVSKDDYGLVDTLAGLYDEPFADSSAIPTYRVCQLARQRVTVALSGDGGDENFAGYRRYLYPKADWAPRMFRAKTTFEALARNLVEGYFHGVSIMPDRVREALFSDSFRAGLQGYRAVDAMAAHAARAPTDDPLSLIQYLDFKTYLPGDILTKVDRASMAHSLEVRVPLLDHKFIEWVAGLPPNVKLKGAQGKHILKKALEPHLPHEVLYRDKKGFSIPVAAWLRGPLRQAVRDAVLSDRMHDTGIFNRGYLERLVEQHESGAGDHSAALWSLLMFEAFLRVSVAS
jgi:asparagine synthase (glutamine-hydrolysing)